MPDSTISANVRRYYDLSDAFFEHSYYVEDKEEAMTILREFCDANGLPFTTDDESRLGQERDKGNGYLLLIFEHPVFSAF